MDQKVKTIEGLSAIINKTVEHIVKNMIYYVNFQV